MSWQQLKYLMSSFAGRFDRSRLVCPDCGCSEYREISRKKLVTRLVECSARRLRFRIPQDPPAHYFDLYQSSYSSTMATECPSREQLDEMLRTSFTKTEKNFSHKVAILKALGLSAGSSVVDYGASWGYGVWQFQQAGFDACGYEISRPRAAYARNELKVSVVDDHTQLPSESFDCMFSSHVLEHVPAPREAFQLASRILRPGGLFVAFTPNGSEACRQAHQAEFDHSWGRLHPLYINAEYLQQHFQDVPWLLTSSGYGQPYDLGVLSSWNNESQQVHDVSGRELLMVIRPRARHNVALRADGGKRS